MSAYDLFHDLTAARNNPLSAEFDCPNLDAMIASAGVAVIAEAIGESFVKQPDD